MSKGSALTWLRAPLDAAALLTGAKSFRDNLFLGSPGLNERGLHVRRMQLAHAMADRRRRRLRDLVSDADAEDFARDGFVERRDFLQPELFAALRRQALETPAPARDTRQGDAITRH